MVAWVVVLTAVSASAAAESRVLDPPRIVPWHRIGDVGLGMTETRVEYTYGQADEHVTPCGYSYHLHGGILDVDYSPSCKRSSNPDRRVLAIATDSSYYRTPSGLGVGSRIPLGPCHLKRGVCEYRWNGFVYHPDKQTPTWMLDARDGRRIVHVILWMSRNRVQEISMAG
jgi:hypothetical protein